MQIADNILRHHLRNCYFINGTAYAGKSTMCRMLAERYGMLHCGENYGLAEMRDVAEPDTQPNLCYTKTMASWQDFVNRTPDEYERWIDGNAKELTEFEIAELLRLSGTLLDGQKIIVDTNIPCDVLWRISDPEHVALLLSPQSMAVDRFFDRPDEDKQFLLSVIRSCPDPEKTLANFKACIARINSPARYEAFRNSGFFVIERSDDGRDTREEMCRKLAAHFGLQKYTDIMQ